MNSLLQNPITPAVRSFGASGGYVSRVGNNLVLSPDSGNQVYLYKGSSWVPFDIPDAGITTPCTGLPFAGDCYVYCYEAGGVLLLEISTTAPIMQSGLLVKTGAVDRLLVARAYAWPTDITTTGQAISGGDISGYANTGAFDNVEQVTVSNTVWASSQSGTGISGVAYIGQDFGTAKTIRAVRIVSYSELLSMPSSIKAQYSDNGSSWTDAGIITPSDVAFKNTLYTVPTPGAGRYFRLLANANLTVGYSWLATELEFGEGSEILVYGSTYNAATDYSKHMLCNVFNKRSVGLRYWKTGTFAMSGASVWMCSNNDAKSRLDFVSDGKSFANVDLVSLAAGSSGYPAAVGIGVDSYLVNSATYFGMNAPITYHEQIATKHGFTAAAGAHQVVWLEYGANGYSVTWAYDYTDRRAGLLAEIQA